MVTFLQAAIIKSFPVQQKLMRHVQGCCEEEEEQTLDEGAMEGRSS